MTERIPQSTAKLVVFKSYLASDHVTESTGKTIAITISKNGGAFGNPAAGATSATEISSGVYKVALGTGDTDTLGPLFVRGAVATIDDVGVLLEVVSATTGGYTNLDAAVSAVKTKTDFLPSVTAGASGGVFIAGTNAATTITTSFTTTFTGNLTGSVGSIATGGIVAASFAAGAINEPAIAADAIGASELRADGASEIATAVWAAATRLLTAGTNIVLAKGTGVTGFTDLDAAGVRTAVGLGSANLDTQLDALPTNAELATALGTADDAVLSAVAALNNLSAAQVNAEVDTALADYDAPTHAELTAELATADDAVLAQVALVKAKTDNLPGDPGDASDIAASISTINSTLATISGYLDTEVAAIKAKTDSLTFTVAGKVDSNIHYVNGIAVTGSGTSGNPWGPA